MLKQSDEVYDLPMGSFGFPQTEIPESRYKVTKVPPNRRHEARDVQVVYPELADVGQRKKWGQGVGVEQLWGEPKTVAGPIRASPEHLDERKQTKLMLAQERFRPSLVLVQAINWNDKSVVEVRDGGNVPGATDQRACEEIGFLVDKIGDDRFDDLQGKPGNRGPGCRMGLRRCTP